MHSASLDGEKRSEKELETRKRRTLSEDEDRNTSTKRKKTSTKRNSKKKKKKKKHLPKRKRARSDVSPSSSSSSTIKLKRLARAILERNYRRVRRRTLRCKKSGTLDHPIGPDGYAPLHIAVLSCYVDACIFILKQGAKVDVVDADGATPLLHAVLLQHGALASALVDRGANASIRDRAGNGPHDFGLVDILRRHRACEVAKDARAFEKIQEEEREWEWARKLRMEDDSYQKSVFSDAWGASERHERWGGRTTLPYRPIGVRMPKKTTDDATASTTKKKKRDSSTTQSPSSTKRPKVPPRRIGPEPRPKGSSPHVSRQDARRIYIERWNAFERQRKDSTWSFAVEGVPWPPGYDAAATSPSFFTDIFFFPPVDRGSTASRRTLIRQEYLRWHPDKFKQRFRTRFAGSASAWEKLLRHVASIAQALSSAKVASVGAGLFS